MGGTYGPSKGVVAGDDEDEAEDYENEDPVLGQGAQDADLGEDEEGSVAGAGTPSSSSSSSATATATGGNTEPTGLERRRW